MNEYFTRLKDDPILVFFKEYQSLILIFPVLLGGFIQCIHLVVLDISFLVFFSITTSISNGIQILIFIFVSIYLFIFIQTFLNTFSPILKRILLWLIFLLSVLYMFISKFDRLSSFLFFLAANVFIFNIFLFLRRKDLIKKYYLLIFGMLFISFVSVPMKFENLRNKVNLTKKVNLKYNKKNAFLVFYNDNVIIYSLNGELFNNKDYLVIKQEELFEKIEDTNDEK